MNTLQAAWKKSFNKGIYRIGLHILFWLVFMLLLKGLDRLIYYSLDANGKIKDLDWINILLSASMFIITFYLTIELAYKRIVFKKAYFTGILGLLICIFFYITLFFFQNKLSYCCLKDKSVEVNNPMVKTMTALANQSYLDFISKIFVFIQIGFSYFIYMFAPLGCKILRDQMRMQKRQATLEKQNVQLELDFLKAQIHPHFLFNTLNNIYSLILQKEAEKSAEMVARLSSLLQYALYDSKSEFIDLEQELGRVKDYIELEKIRLDAIKLKVILPLAYPKLKIPPFLLLPLVENAFKHGANKQLNAAWIKIEIKIDDMELRMSVENSFNPNYSKESTTGLGLQNLRKRLNYYYPDTYILITKKEADKFISILKFPLICPELNA